jgi:hypothetical protein
VPGKGGMTKNAKTVWLVGIGAVAFLAIVFVWHHHFRSEIIDCGDGPRHTVDLREFRTRYSAYAVEFEGSIADKAKFGGKIEPRQLQQLSEAVQQANEFRKFLVAGFNSCAIGKKQFEHYATQFQTMDGLARRIDAFLAKPALAEAERAQLAQLVERYVQLTAELQQP